MMSDNVVAVTERIRLVFTGHDERVALMYSGGLESNLLLALARPWKDRITVFHLRTGAEFPHMIAFTDAALAGWDHKVTTTHVMQYFGEVGLPAHVVPIEHQPNVREFFGQVRGPHIVPWLECCDSNRGWGPLIDSGLKYVIHGQRAKDFFGPRRELGYDGLNVCGPLWDCSRQDVRAMIAELGVEIPSNYSEYEGSLDCAICPAMLTRRRRQYMMKHYPEQLVTAEQLQALVSVAVLSALSGETTFHNRTEDSISELVV